MARSPRLSSADRADLAARHRAVTARVLASEDIARTVLRDPVEQATQQLIVRLASESPDPRAIKRTLYRSVNSISGSLAHSAAMAVERARGHARELANGQAQDDLSGFVQQAQAAGFDAVAPTLTGIVTTSEVDAAIAHQAGLSIAHRWSSQVLGTYVSWKRGGGGVDLLARGIGSAAGSDALESGTGVGALVEAQAITQSIDAYADQHALVWRDLATVIPGTIYEAGPGGSGPPPGADGAAGCSMFGRQSSIGTRARGARSSTGRACRLGRTGARTGDRRRTRAAAASLFRFGLKALRSCRAMGST